MDFSRETIRLKFRNTIYIPMTAKWRSKQLLVRDFTIISNNCWGGTIYESYGMQKKTPFVGMFIMPKDYLALAKNLAYYLDQPLHFINAEESKWCNKLKNKSNWGTYLIGKLDDIELHMLHYHDEALARKKWSERVKRVNFDKLVFKFNDQNDCIPQYIEEFMNLTLLNKLCFVASEQLRVTKEVILIKQPIEYTDGIKASWEPYGKSSYVDMTMYLNQLREK